MSLVGFAAAVLLLTIISTATDAKYMEGVIDTAKDMEFLERFVFEPDELGQLWYEFKYPAELCCYQMVIFNDKPQQWPYVRENEDKLTFLEKKAQIPGHYNTQVTLSTPYNCINNTEDGKQMLVCSGTHHFMAKRARWWFINVANCNNMSLVEGIHMQYKLNMTNGIRPMDMHFSADERYTLQRSITFAVLYFLMMLGACYYQYELTRKRLLHSTYQLFFFSILLQLASLTFSVVALASFARNGTEMPDLKTAGNVLSSVSDVVFLLTLMLVAKGYTITRGRISTDGSVKLAIFITMYVLTVTFLSTFSKANYDSRDVMFIHDNPAGMGILVMRCIGFVWLYYCIFFTAKHFHEKFKICLLLMVFCLIWFAAEPVMIGVANAFIPNYKRVEVMTDTYWAVSFTGQLSFLILYRLDRTNEYFLYHIKTNQVRFENEKQPAIDTRSPPKGKKHGMKIPAMFKKIKPQQAVAKKSSASVASATGILASPVTNDCKISEPGTEVKQRSSEFVEILLDDLTITD